MKIRRPILPMLLLLLVLFAQQAAYVHALSHVPGEGHPTQLDAYHAGDGECLTCLAFAAGTGPMLGKDGVLAVVGGHEALVPQLVVVLRSSTAEHYRARAPPRLS